MKVKLKLNPGERDTKKMQEQYNDKLPCVRYRYDEATKKRCKTVELIVEETKRSPKIDPDNHTLLFINWNEKELKEIVIPAKNSGIMLTRQGITPCGCKTSYFSFMHKSGWFEYNPSVQRIIKNAGRTWSKHKKLWNPNYNTILKLGLESRIRNE